MLFRGQTATMWSPEQSGGSIKHKARHATHHFVVRRLDTQINPWRSLHSGQHWCNSCSEVPNQTERAAGLILGCRWMCLYLAIWPKSRWTGQPYTGRFEALLVPRYVPSWTLPHLVCSFRHSHLASSDVHLLEVLAVVVSINAFKCRLKGVLNSIACAFLLQWSLRMTLPCFLQSWDSLTKLIKRARDNWICALADWCSGDWGPKRWICESECMTKDRVLTSNLNCQQYMIEIALWV